MCAYMFSSWQKPSEFWMWRVQVRRWDVFWKRREPFCWGSIYIWCGKNHIRHCERVAFSKSRLKRVISKRAVFCTGVRQWWCIALVSTLVIGFVFVFSSLWSCCEYFIKPLLHTVHILLNLEGGDPTWQSHWPVRACKCSHNSPLYYCNDKSSFKTISRASNIFSSEWIKRRSRNWNVLSTLKSFVGIFLLEIIS